MSRASGNTDSSQDTFRSIRACLEKTAVICRAAADDLQDHLNEVNPTYQEALSRMVSTEHELAQLLADYASQGPEKVLATRVQFFPQLPETPDSSSVGEAIQYLQLINGAGVENLREQINNVIAPDVAEELDTLWRDAETLCRRISVTHTTMRDI
ncbi:hypothetical protein GCM10011403_06830 [Pseudohongiella nitratireducens]|jgi:hypothetical protein|uniref:Uncharacterized protein n=1 Tax=Pseudohongiella nitratireducens TaxID=1768907 RepID=A0A917GP06_9GAMM|nr:hypothetical protein [Pseudohongiella nitratireducens]GGG52268.1 hypothetical protein GCM10011403_06830 [Pseudohongiella nitratireducens]|tara:strand:+ start:4205 stop:4669 length:465 start_codon:yes stop_codon:yes gene_type:complete